MTGRFEWFDENNLPPEPKKLSKHAVQHDRWDRADMAKSFKELPPFSGARKALGDFTPTGAEAIEDAFLSFFRAEPGLVDTQGMRPSYAVNRMIAEEMKDLPATERLRRYSVGDDVQAALSAAALEPDLETLFDRAKKAQQAGQDYEDALNALAAAEAEATDIDEMIARWSEDHEGEETPQEMQDQQEAAQKAAQEAQEAAETASQALGEEMGKASAGVSAGLGTAMEKAADEAEAMGEAARGYGLDGGELHRLPAAKRIELAKRLNTPRLRKIADLFGCMRNLLFAEQSRKVTHSREELFDVETGSDLGRILPQEILNLREGPTRLDFLRRYTEGQLLQYALKGTEKLARGAIIMCEDGSGSMSGERELWAKGLMLALLNFAKIQKRAFHLIHFGSRGQMWEKSFEKPEDFTFENIIECAEKFWAGGTDFNGPMTRSLQLLETEHRATGKVRADVVFVTDDECYCAPNFLEDYLKRMEAVGSTTWGVSVGRGVVQTGPLYQMSQGKVCTVSALIRTGSEVSAIFRGI